MNQPINVVRLRHPDNVDDPLTEVLRAGARWLLAQAVELEAEAFLAGMQDLKLPDGRARVVRHGHGPERPIQTGIGTVIRCLKRFVAREIYTEVLQIRDRGQRPAVWLGLPTRRIIVRIGMRPGESRLRGEVEAERDDNACDNGR